MPIAVPPLADCPVALSVFSVCDHHPGLKRDLRAFYRGIIASAVLAEEPGVGGYWVAEHHFHQYGVGPNPAPSLATRRERADPVALRA
jgi:hypothetical protein